MSWVCRLPEALAAASDLPGGNQQEQCTQEDLWGGDCQDMDGSAALCASAGEHVCIGTSQPCH